MAPTLLRVHGDWQTVRILLTCLTAILKAWSHQLGWMCCLILEKCWITVLNSYSFWQNSTRHEQSLLQLLHLSKQNRLSVPYSIHQYSMKPGHHKSPQNQTSSINPKSHTRHHGTNGHYTHVQQLPADVAKGLWHLQGLHQHHASAVFPWCWVQVGGTKGRKTLANALLSSSFCKVTSTVHWDCLHPIHPL